MSELVQPDDIRQTATLSAAALRPFLGENWSTPARGLEWTARETLVHMCRVPFSYFTHLSSRQTGPTPYRLGPLVNRSDGEPADPEVLVEAMVAMGGVLADVVAATPPEARGFHQAGMADRSGFAAMGCDELLIHTEDIVAGFGGTFRPPDDLARRILARLFPWAPSDVDPWRALRWANGRDELSPPYGRLGPDWVWHCAPLEEWDGTMPRFTTS